MEELFIYLLKSSGLIAAFYLAYYFLLRKETFFTSNRWFLLTGLITSVSLPLFFLEKIVVVEAPKSVPNPIINTISNAVPTQEIIKKSIEIDWFQIGICVYGIIALALLFKVFFNLISLFKVLENKQVTKQDKFQFIDVTENLSPFSFFNYIVYNSSLYSESELQSILLHEKIHSAQRHSLDVLVTNLFSILFWFNPFMYLYKKAVTQNLEYIADSEAIAQIDDKKSYQMALLKVVSHQNCLPITNHFYQSLIKKRIVMLNKNQSNKRNSWKYAAIIPALVGFVILFQVKVIAQEKEVEIKEYKTIYDELTSFSVDKNSTDVEMKENAENLKKQSGVDVKFSKIKRNSKGEITAVKIDYKDKNGNKGSSYVNSDKPIETITIFKTKNSVGIKTTSDTVSHLVKDKVIVYNNDEDGYARDFETLVNPDEEGKNLLVIINGKEYFKNDLKNLNFSVDGLITQYDSEEAVKRFGPQGKDGAWVFNGETKIIDDLTFNQDFPAPPTPPTPPVAPTINFEVAKFPNMPKAPVAPNGTPLNNEKEWKKFEKKMEEFEKKMQAMEPEIEAYAKKMANVDEQMKPFEKEMEAFEKKMEIFEKQMEVYQEKMDAYREKERAKR
jgi:BlaR1 peptidase M56